MKIRPAQVIDLSASLRAVVSYTPSGAPDSLLLVRGNRAFAVSGGELPKLREGLEPRRLAGVEE